MEEIMGGDSGMKRFYTVFLVCFVAFILVGEGGALRSAPAMGAANENKSQKLSVFASFYPMYDFAVKIGGERVNVTNLVPAGAEPHDWEPAAADIADLEKASVFVYNGAGMEHWVGDVLDALQNRSLISVEASGGIKLLEGHHHGHEDEDHEDHEDEDHEDHDHEDHEDEDHDHENETHDPHVWLSPVYAKAEMENIKNALIQADPEGKSHYEANYEKYAAECDALDQEFKNALAPLAKKDIVVTHQAFGYLCEKYGLRQVPIEGLSPDSEPDPGRMAEIIEFVKEHDVTVIFFEELVSPKVAETIAKATGAATDMLSPIEGLGEEEIASGADYFTVMRRNLKSLVAALQ
jgi:zinc transport system substrate-binding protein